MTPRPLLFVNATGEMSGAEVVLLALAGEALRRGHPVTVACPPGRLAEQLPVGCAHVPLPLLNLGSGPLPWRLVRYAARSWAAARVLRPHASAERLTILNSLPAVPAARLARPPGGVVWLVHDVVHRRDQRLLLRLTAGVVARAVAVSSAVAASLAPLGVPAVVSRNGVRWPAPVVDLQPHSPPVVGALALLTPWKGHRVLLEAVARLPSVRLELAGGAFPGDASYAAELRERADRPDLRGRVTFLGVVDRDQALQGWDVMVSASTSPEAHPLSVLEALSAGVPVIGTAHGGTVEILTEGAGVLVPPGDVGALADAIQDVLGDPDLRRRVARRGLEVAEQHDSARMVPAMLDALVGGAAAPDRGDDAPDPPSGASRALI